MKALNKIYNRIKATVFVISLPLLVYSCGSKAQLMPDLNDRPEDSSDSFDISYRPSDFDIDMSEYYFDYSTSINNYLEEASGIIEGRINTDKFFLHNDRGHANLIYLFDNEGERLGQYLLKGAGSIDYEDISGFTDSEGEHYIYLGDIGDNPLNRKYYSIYSFKEPDAVNQENGFSEDINNIKTIKYTYPNPANLEETISFDCEAMFVEPQTNDIYLFTKSATKSHVYKLCYPFADTIQHATYLGLMRIHGEKVTAADISTDGTSILVKTYETVFMWKRDTSTSIAEMLQEVPVRLPYNGEVQGEAICFTSNGGYATTSELSNGEKPLFSFYSKQN